MFVVEVCLALEKAGVPYALVGGYGVSLHGAVRGTFDVDLIIDLKKEHLENLEATMHSLGLRSRLPVNAATVFTHREDYITNRNLIAWNFIHPSDASKQVDIVLTHDLATLSAKAITTDFGTVYVLDKKHLIEMKRQSARPQDLEDIKALEKIR